MVTALRIPVLRVLRLIATFLRPVILFRVRACPSCVTVLGWACRCTPLIRLWASNPPILTFRWSSRTTARASRKLILCRTRAPGTLVLRRLIRVLTRVAL